MSDVAIRVENLGKMYRIGTAQERHDTLRDALVHFLRDPLGRKGRNGDEEIIWALKDVSFEVKRGEVVGVIGRNGAGKSTLLKILSRITEPSEGLADLYGRVGSLLEVGTGFHPELTGRENIYLSGAILGMHKTEIDRRFDEIVAFAEIDKFLDTPVKRYSSGMYVRLGFAVAAHLDPEILIVDEVLAVGDAQFQKKCLGKMGDVAREGRTVLFVSHNMGAVGELCTRSLLLEGGSLAAEGSTPSIVQKYLENGSVSSSEVDLTEWSVERTTKGSERFVRLSYRSIPGNNNGIVLPGETLVFKMQLRLTAGSRYHLSLIVRNAQGVMLYNCPSSDAGFVIEDARPLEEVEVTFPDIELAPGAYFVTLWLADSAKNLLDRVGNCLRFEVTAPLGRQYDSKGCIFKVPQWKLLQPSMSEAEIEA
ncbi:MAG: ABC transporter ATP-binding protein [Chloroflexi bacterium]|nr:ABC transporter ATP-binding protein [Chloroflexota bacterium]